MKKKSLAANKRGLAGMNSNKNRAKRILSYSHLPVFFGGVFVLILTVYSGWLNVETSPSVSAAETSDEIENALFSRQEFFGAEAIVPLPTNEAQENLARIAQNSGENPAVLEKLAELDEKLEKYDEAEKNLIRLSEIDATKTDALAAFYHRRAAFEKEGEVLRKVLFTTDAGQRAGVFERLIDLARIHDLKAYLTADFYTEVMKENPGAYLIFEKLINRLIEEKNHTEALKFIRQAKTQFPERRSVLLNKEIETLLEINQPKEAETVYVADFDPFWSEDEAEKFYEFLSSQDRLREYGAELKAKFKNNPADFETGIRFALYQNYDGRYEENNALTPVILKIEAAKKNWTTEELVTATRILLRNNDGATASRFLYTLYLREDFRKNSAQRARILYQLFELFADAENQRLPLVKGDLRFYEDVARTDTNPGITTGILSLIFSDTNPKQQLEEQENTAGKFFNRAAAYRIFEEYKKESPTMSPQLAQMYLNLISLYLKSNEPEIARNILNEYAERCENSTDYAGAAMKLADGFSAMKNETEAREIYQKVLDFIGKQGKPLAPKIVVTEDDSETAEDTSPNSYSSYNQEKPTDFTDHLADKNEETTYDEVLEIYVNSLSKEKKTAEILALYSNEIAKHPNEEWLYERRLTWLEQTNLTGEKLDFYKATLARFQTESWRDKLARFFVRENRSDEFAAFSEDLAGKLNDTELQTYLLQFINGKASSPKEFEKQLYLKLYQSAHARFPHNTVFTNVLLYFYRFNEQEDEWRKLAAEYYFESKEVRESFLDRLAEKGELRRFLQNAGDKQGIAYELFRADASARLSDYENAVAAYRKLNEIYPHTSEFSERLISLTRSFGQKNRDFLTEAAKFSQSNADFEMSSAEYRTRSGEIFAELGDYKKSREEWEKLIPTASGSREIYLDAATVYWDYFQFEDARRTIVNLRKKFADKTLYAFEDGAILEAQDKQDEAIGEYVKAFDADRNDEQKEKATKRLAKMTAKNPDILPIINSAFARESSNRTDASFLALGYAEFLAKIKQVERAEATLNRAVAQSQNTEFLEAAKDFYQIEDNQAGEQNVLKRLVETSDSPRRSISFQLQLAKSFEDSRQREAAKAVLGNLIRQFPTNYGVLTETSDIFWRLGFDNEAVNVLQNALPKSKGAYQNALAKKLVELLIPLNRLDSAEQLLTNLHAKIPADTDIFHELANLCVRTNRPDVMRKAFDETVKALRASDVKDRRALDEQIADLRVSMIEAFTRTRDYHSAVEQHIEIINREPENEELTENAVRYVRRYGGAEILLDYYLKISAEAFKNYRWNVVLARIYEANKDTENAVKNYQTAIINQPEMPELYLAITDIETHRNNFDAALQNLDTVLKLTNDAPIYVKKKIEILKRAGRTAEIEAEQAKLPAEEKKIVKDEFAEARLLDVTEKEKARTLYREAFGKLFENPLNGEMKSTDIAAYIKSVREEESLNQIAERLWNLREKLIAVADADNSTDAAEARNRLGILDNAMIETIASIAKNYGTDEELAALHENLRTKIEAISPASDRHQSVSLMQDLSVRAGFGDLAEAILQKKIADSISESARIISVHNLVSFYNERGAYQKTFDVLEKYGSDDLPLKAEMARTVGNKEKEMAALRAIYWKPAEKFAASNDENVARFLEVLFAENREELKTLTEKSSVYQLQTINFLLGKGERELAHQAIENAALPLSWKASRHAETSLALKEFDDTAECFFCAALQIDSIGNLVRQTPDKKRFLINDDWFRLTREYGEWLFEKQDKTISPSKFLTAMTENQPDNAEEQFKLGKFYLRKKDYGKAIEHLRLAIEVENLSVEDETKLTTLGAAYLLAGDRHSAETVWGKVLANEENLPVEIGLNFFDILQTYGLSREAREKMPPFITGFLENNNAENSKDFQELIRRIAASFDIETEKTDFFRHILKVRSTDKSLAAMLLNENLIARNEQREFYEMLISRYDKSDSGDYDFSTFGNRFLSGGDAESIYEQENDYKVNEPENERVEWQRKYLEYLLERSENPRIISLTAEIEKDLEGLYVRPTWLRLAKINAQIRAGKFDRTDAERFIGITVSDSVTEIKPPNLERLNEVRRILTAEKRDAEAVQISAAFFARMFALGQFNAANFTGFARAFFQNGETENGLRVLELMIRASDEETKETALAEISTFETVKTHSADSVKVEENTGILPNRSDALKFAAEISLEFNRRDRAIEFRRLLLSAAPNDSANKIELAQLLDESGEKAETEILLTQIINDRNALRSARWQARALLKAEIPDSKFDAFSQFYQGIFAARNSQGDAATQFFINSFIDDKDAAIGTPQELIKIYALNNQPFAALKFAATDKTVKSDELLQTLSEAAEKIGDFQKAVEFERAKSNGGNPERIVNLQRLFAEKNSRATNFTIDAANTRNL